MLLCCFQICLSLIPTIYILYMIGKFSLKPLFVLEKKNYMFFLKMLLILFLIVLCFFQFIEDLLFSELSVLIYIVQKLIFILNWAFILSMFAAEFKKTQAFPQFLKNFYILNFAIHLIFKFFQTQVFFLIFLSHYFY